MDEQTIHTEPAVRAKQRTASPAIPIAIVFGFGLVALAIFFSGGGLKQAGTGNGDLNLPSPDETAIEPIRPVDENDHIRGNPNAPIMIVEYSDYDCPFCKNFHETMNRIMSEYGNDGKVAWVYRHFPLEQLHPSAPRLAQASECVAELGGTEAFWKFSDQIFGERGTNEPTNVSRLTEFAESAGVSGTAFDSCLSDERMKEKVDEDYVDGINAGAKGTPYSVVIVGGQQGIINGAQPYEYVKQIVDTLLEQIEGTEAQ